MMKTMGSLIRTLLNQNPIRAIDSVLSTQDSVLFLLWPTRISYASMLRSARQGVESVRVAGERSFPQIVRFIRAPTPGDCFRFGNVNDVDTRRCRNVPPRQARRSIRMSETPA